MENNNSAKRTFIRFDSLPKYFPTNKHSAEFWQHLGRAIATFGFLEEVLGKAIFVFTATREYLTENDCKADYEKWHPKLEKALSDTLNPLIDTYGKAVRDHHSDMPVNFKKLIDDLRDAASHRNVLCHGSWGMPDDDGKSVPRYINRQTQIFTSKVDVPYLEQTQTGTAELGVAVINTVTQAGFQFPGSGGPGKPVV